MKRLFRLALRAGTALAALVVVTGIVCFQGLDTRRYVGESYYLETSSRLWASTQTNGVVRGELKAGFAKEVLTPAINSAEDAPARGQFKSLPLAGYGNRQGKPAQGVHDELYVKALALQVNGRLGVMVAADALIIPPEVADKAARDVEKELGLTRSQLYLGATHTHSSLGAWGAGMVAESFAGGYQPAVRTWFADRIVAAVRSALGQMKPARFGHGSFAAPEYIRNRLKGSSGAIDPEFTYALLEQEGGNQLVLGVYGAHATTLSGDMMEFSGDYPGYWERAVERATGGMAMFFAGGVGSHSPVPGAGGLAGAERMGEALARLVLDKLPQTPLTNLVTFGALGLDVALPAVNVRVSDGIRLRPWLAGRLLHTRNHTFIQVFRICDSIWVSAPCDFSGELALGIKKEVKAKGCDAVVTSFNGDYIGYVIPSRYYHLNGYEPRLMSFFGPNLADYLDGLIRGMASNLATNR